MLCAPTDIPTSPSQGRYRERHDRRRRQLHRPCRAPAPPLGATLPGASIVKVSVGPMDNNAYLVTCSQTGETLLIDAANDAEILLELIERVRPEAVADRHQPPASGPLAGAADGRQGHRGADRRPRARRRAAAGQAGPDPGQRRHRQGRRAVVRRHPPAGPYPGIGRAGARRTPTTRPTCSPATACFPAASARRGRKATSSSCSATSAAGSSTSTATRRSSIPATATTPRWGPSGPHLDEWKERGW